jgi:hypothetical protein
VEGRWGNEQLFLRKRKKRNGALGKESGFN